MIADAARFELSRHRQNRARELVWYPIIHHRHEVIEMKSHLWRSVKYEEIYLKSYTSLIEAHAALAEYFEFYNEQRPHSQLGRRPPAHVYRDLLQRKAV